MIVCETEFKMEDPNHKGYSLSELDFGCIPSGSVVQNLRLSLRKNLTTGNFEVYLSYSQTMKSRMVTVNTAYGSTPVHIIRVETNIPLDAEEVVFQDPSLQKTLNFAENEWDKFHNPTGEPRSDRDKICLHRPPNVSSSCELYYGGQKNV